MNLRAARQSRPFGSDTKPIAHARNRTGWVSVIGMNVLARYIRKEGAISKGIAIQDKAVLGMFSFPAISLAAQKQSQFQRHIETRQTRSRIHSYVGEIV